MDKPIKSQPNTKIDKQVYAMLREWLDSGKAKEAGFDSQSRIVSEAVREFIEKYKTPRFEHINFHDNMIRLLDNDEPKGTPFIDIFLKEDIIFCNSCKTKTCIHIEECWKDVAIRKVLQKKGIFKVSLN